jgi:hypothetical protein
MQLHVSDTFLFNGSVYRSGSILTVSESQLAEEIERGVHPNPKKDPRKVERYLSGVLTHCSPADDATAKFISKATGQEVEVPEEEEEKKDDPSELGALHKEFDEMGAAYDKRWGLQKTQNELLKAKKNRGL